MSRFTSLHTIYLDGFHLTEAFSQLATDPDEARLPTAVDLYKRPFLEGFYDDWVIDERYRLQTTYINHRF